MLMFIFIESQLQKISPYYSSRCLVLLSPLTSSLRKLLTFLSNASVLESLSSKYPNSLAKDEVDDELVEGLVY